MTPGTSTKWKIIELTGSVAAATTSGTLFEITNEDQYAWIEFADAWDGGFSGLEIEKFFHDPTDNSTPEKWASMATGDHALPAKHYWHVGSLTEFDTHRDRLMYVGEKIRIKNNHGTLGLQYRIRIMQFYK